jgi:response regulator NasT
VNSVTNPLRILAADEDEPALSLTTAVLERLGHTVTATAVDLAEATEAIAREDPDLSVVVAHTDDEHALGLIEEISAFARGPVIVLVAHDEDGAFVARAAERGIYAAVRSNDETTLQDAIEVAMRRHAEQARLATQIDQLESALERRALIERAKGIMMERHQLSAAEAFERLRVHARSNNRPILAVARDVSDGHGVPG